MTDKTIQKRNARLAKIDIELARKQVAYNPLTGEFTWLIRSPGRTEVGQPAGFVTEGYLVIGIQGQKVLAHLLAWMLMTGTVPVWIIDHADGDSLNNRWINLREASRADNNRNSRVRSHSRVGIKGVQRHRSGRYVAKIQFDGKQRYLGIFDTPEEAGDAYRAAAETHYGEFARIK